MLGLLFAWILAIWTAVLIYKNVESENCLIESITIRSKLVVRLLRWWCYFMNLNFVFPFS